MLDLLTIKKIEDFVAQKPRSIQEISIFIKKNWRTVDRYIDYIKQNFGTIETRTFREGTRGALKIAYYADIQTRKSTIFQDKLQKEIEFFKRKEDFSAFDIYQHVPDKNKKLIIEKKQSEDQTDLRELYSSIKQTKKQLLIFSGNLSWINLKNKQVNIYEELDNLVKNNISLKVLCRVDITSIQNIKKLLELNFKYGRQLIEVRHREQPLRANIYDGKLISIKEIKEPTGKINELNQKTFIFYYINDKEWVDWISKVFYNLFSNSIDANKRIEQIQDLI